MRQATNYGDKRVITYQPEKTMREGSWAWKWEGSGRVESRRRRDRIRQAEVAEARKERAAAAAAAAAVRAPKRRGSRPELGGQGGCKC